MGNLSAVHMRLLLLLCVIVFILRINVLFLRTHIGTVLKRVEIEHTSCCSNYLSKFLILILLRHPFDLCTMMTRTLNSLQNQLNHIKKKGSSKRYQRFCSFSQNKLKHLPPHTSIQFRPPIHASFLPPKDI